MTFKEFLDAVLLYIWWMGLCMPAGLVGGLLLWLCARPLRKGGEGGPIQNFAGRAARLGQASMLVSTAGVILYCVWVFIAPSILEICLPFLFASVLLCGASGVLLLVLARRQRRAMPGGRRPLACLLCGLASLLIFLPGAVLSIQLLTAL